MNRGSCIQYSIPFLPTGIITLSGQGGGGGGGDGLTQEGQECWLWAGPMTRDRTVSGGQTRYEQRAEKLAVGRLAINRGQECWQLADST